MTRAMTRRPLAALTLAGLAAAAQGQSAPSFVYHFDVGNSVLAPGQTTTVTILCGFSPGVGSPIFTLQGPLPVHGLSSGAFSLAGTGGGWTLGPAPSGSLIAPYNFIGTTHGTPNGGNVSGVIWGNGFGPPLGTVSTVNPTPLWQATFTAPATLGPVILNAQPLGIHGVWIGLPGSFSVEATSTQTTGAQTIINVIPAPASSALAFGALAVAVARRRRAPSRHQG